MKTMNTMNTIMKKKFFLPIAILLLALALMTPAAAFASDDAAGDDPNKGARQNRYIDVDGEALLSASEADALMQRLDEVSGSYGFDVVVFVIYDLKGWEAHKWAAELYESYGFGMDSQNSGAVLLLAMKDRDFGIATTGRGLEILTMKRQENVKSMFVPYLKKNDYYNAFMAFADGVEKFIVEDALGGPVDSGGVSSSSRDRGGISSAVVIFSIIIALVIALVIVLIWKAQLKSVRPQNLATQYVRPGSMIITGHSDRFLYSHVTQTAKPKDDSSSSSGGGFTSSSGSSWSGSSGKF